MDKCQIMSPLSSSPTQDVAEEKPLFHLSSSLVHIQDQNDLEQHLMAQADASMKEQQVSIEENRLRKLERKEAKLKKAYEQVLLASSGRKSRGTDQNLEQLEQELIQMERDKQEIQGRMKESQTGGACRLFFFFY
jgi:ATP-dependent exoDNAse (exonuclease V) alpha subunit